MTDDPCKTEANLLYSNLNNDLQRRYSRIYSIFHISNAFFVPNGEKVIVPNFVDSNNDPKLYSIGTRPELKKNAKSTLRHWTKEKSKFRFLTDVLRFFQKITVCLDQNNQNCLTSCGKTFQRVVNFYYTKPLTSKKGTIRSRRSFRQVVKDSKNMSLSKRMLPSPWLWQYHCPRLRHSILYISSYQQKLHEPIG